MLSSSLEKRYKFTLNQRRFFFVGLVISFCLNIILGLLLIGKDKETILVPLSMDSPISISKSGMSQEYIASLSLFFSEHLFNNLNKDSGVIKLKGIAPYMSSNAYEKAKIHIEKQQKDLEKYDNSTKFDVSDTQIQNEKVIIYGEVFYFRKGIQQLKRDVIAILTFKYDMGRVMLDDFEVSLNEETDKEKKARKQQK